MTTHLRVIQALLDGESLGREKLYSAFGFPSDETASANAGWQSLLNAAEDFGYVALEGNRYFTLTEPLLISQRTGLHVDTERFPNTREKGAQWFRWNGDKGGTMIFFDRSLDCKLGGFVVETDDQDRKMNPAGIGILFDGGYDTNPESDKFGGSCILYRMVHYTHPGSLDVEATFCAISLRSQWNQEFHQLIDCAGNGAGRGTFLRIGSPNSKAIRVSGRRFIDGYRKAIVMDNGSLYLDNLNMSNNEWDIWASGDSTGWIWERGHIGEHSKHHIFTNVEYLAESGTWDNQDTLPRSQLITNPLNYDSQYPESKKTVENAWVIFAAHCRHAEIRNMQIGGARNPEAKLFGFMDAADYGRVYIHDNALAEPTHSLRTLGIDPDTMGALNGLWNVELSHRKVNRDPAKPNGISDLPNGRYEWGDQGTVRVRVAGTPVEPTQIDVADQPPAWTKIARGQRVEYQTAKSKMYRSVDKDGRRKQGMVGQDTEVP